MRRYDRVTFLRARYIILNTLAMTDKPIDYDELCERANRVATELVTDHGYDTDTIPLLIKSHSSSPNSVFNDAMAQMQTNGRVKKSPPRRGVVGEESGKPVYYVTKKGYQTLLRATDTDSIPVDMKTAIQMAAHREGKNGFNKFSKPENDPVTSPETNE